MALANVARLFGRRLPWQWTVRAGSDAAVLSRISENFLHKMDVSYTNRMQFIDPKAKAAISIFRIMDIDGRVTDRSIVPSISTEALLTMYQKMLLIEKMDEIMYNSQRQGRISFYMTSTGEEGAMIASCLALDPEDLVYSQYRELGAFFIRGFTVQQVVDQAFGNVADSSCGRQMPMHIGCKELNMVTISSPLGTQLPQAVGSAYAYKLASKKQVVMCYFGEGAASEGDCGVSLNFAATLRCPVVFFCRNNGYAISTPAVQQYGGDGVAGFALGYGLRVIRVDGNDVLAVYAATSAARQLALDGNPCLIEAITYRVGHHSTSDDSTVYRDDDEVKFWAEFVNPTKRLERYLLEQNLLNEEKIRKLAKEANQEVMKALADGEKKPKPPIVSMLSDVYKESPPRLEAQQRALEEHLKLYESSYPMKKSFM